MLSHTPGVGHWRWAGDAAGTGDVGDVVWDRYRQRGYLLLRGFVANDPAHARYQLWIFDGARDERYPVDGGLFDVPPGRAEVVIPVQATLPVVRPTAFAVTVEEPGGAVVSQREKLVAIAQTGG
jgi:anti-sigma-K factor RskA